MIDKNKIGDYGEVLASKHLIDLGYNIISRNYRTKFGEIDIIAAKQHVLIFIEVKTRYNSRYGLPCESVNYKKRKHIMTTSQIFISSKKLYNFDVQYDVIEVILNYSNDSYSINHIKSAFSF